MTPMLVAAARSFGEADAQSLQACCLGPVCMQYPRRFNVQERTDRPFQDCSEGAMSRVFRVMLQVRSVHQAKVQRCLRTMLPLVARHRPHVLRRSRIWLEHANPSLHRSGCLKVEAATREEALLSMLTTSQSSCLHRSRGA